MSDTDDDNRMDEIALFSSDDDMDDNYKEGITEVKETTKLFNGEIPWVEKYRPKKLNDIIEHDEIIKILKKTVETGELPHLLLHGPPGTGKTSTILAVAKELYGPEKIHDRVIELNASDDRGIGTVRNKIISFAKMALSTADPNYPSPNFKIIILDEADYMTPEAQAALRKVMEKMSKITRFCFICNYIGQIIDPITSRCMRLKFKPIKSEAILDKIKEISRLENLNISNDCLNTLIDMSGGDARRTIMNLQNLQYLMKYNPNITPKDILQMNGTIDKEQFANFWKICSSGSIESIKKLTTNLCREGFVIKSILKYLMDSIINSNIIDRKKSDILLELCKTDRKLSEGCDEYLQLLNILLYTRTICVGESINLSLGNKLQNMHI
jgi:replication factor C subunit 2/4